MSRPWVSVPSRYCSLPPSIQAGGRLESMSCSVARSNGSCGATHGAHAEATAQASATSAAAIATGEERKLYQTSLSKNRARAVRIAGRGVPGAGESGRLRQAAFDERGEQRCAQGQHVVVEVVARVVQE